MTNAQTKQSPTLLNQLSLASLPPDVRRPEYDRSEIAEGILHFGVGAFHRSHQARYLDELFAKGCNEGWGIHGCGIRSDSTALRRSLAKQSCLYSLLERDEGTEELRIVGSLVNYSCGLADPERVISLLARKGIKLVTLTVTEGGYYLNHGSGELNEDDPDIINDRANPRQPKSILGYLAAGLESRMINGGHPLTVLSCDNIQGNGVLLRKLLLTFLDGRRELRSWVEDNVSFPCCMVDRITPVITAADRDAVLFRGVVDEVPVVSEPFTQWIIEDSFVAGRPPLEDVGVSFVPDVAPYERMKLRLLNATHSAMGYLGYLAGYRFIDEIARDGVFARYLRRLMDREVTSTVGAVPGIDLEEYKRTVLHRFANPKIKDQALRICMDGSSKIPKFILPTLRQQLASGGPIEMLSLCLAGWFRFLKGLDTEGAPIPIVDPLGERLSALASRQDVSEIMSFTQVFGDLGSHPQCVSTIASYLERLNYEPVKMVIEAALSREA